MRWEGVGFYNGGVGGTESNAINTILKYKLRHNFIQSRLIHMNLKL